jgi:TPR repeat protein
MCLFLFIYIVFSNGEVTKLNFDEPRNEISRNITSGEMAWLNSLQEDRLSRNVKPIITNRKGHEESTRFRRYWSTDSKESDEKTPTTHDSSLPFNKNPMTHELLELSQPHGLNVTSSIDRITMAQLLNTVHSEDKNIPNSSVNVASYFLGLFSIYGLGMEESDPENAIKYLHKAAENGHGDAQCALGLILYYGIEGKVRIDKKIAFRWFYRASKDSNHPRGYWLLGKAIYEGMFYDDIGVSPIYGEEDEEDRKENVGGKVVTQRKRFLEAENLFRKAAEYNVPDAMHQIAVMYEYNLIGKTSDKHENLRKAMKMYINASNMGYVESLYNIGLMYAYGRGIALSHISAAEYFRQAAMKKHSPSMRYLAIFAMNGYDQFDLAPNLDLAIFWFKKCLQHAINIPDVENLCQSELSELKLIDKTVRNHQSKVYLEKRNSS